MTTPPSAAVYKNRTCPEWGLGLVIEDAANSWVLVFEHGGRKKFIKSKATTLVAVNLSKEELERLQAKVHGKQAVARGTKPKVGRGPTKSTARFATFDDQLRFFEQLFVGGFEGERFVNEERGAPGVMGKAGYKTAAIARAQAELSPASFERASVADLFESAKRVLGATNIVFPIEGPIPFGALAREDRPAAIMGLKQLLHGESDYPMRLEQFAGSVNLRDKSGKGKKVTWPMATLFAALYFPTEHTCVKPTAFAAQGATLGLPVEKSQPVTASAYRQFFEIARVTQERLLTSGHRPRDLVDVYSFIWRTHAEKPA
jgi:hypothetical protein